MSFQGNVNFRLTPHTQGQVTRDNPLNVLPFFAEDALCFAGGFVFAGTNAETQVIGLDAGATVVEGIAKRTPYQSNRTGGDSNVYNEGSELTIILTGYVAVKVSTATVKGQDVVVNPTTGVMESLVLDATDSNMPAGFIRTDWKVNAGADADTLCEIYKL